MIRLLQISILLLLSTSFSFGQTFGNEWIDYSQSYYKFDIVQDGIYTIDYNTLNAAGIPVGTFQSENIQVFGKEKEIPIYIEDGGDNSIDPGDYILFYAERNTGWLDSTLYQLPTTIGNPAYSLYNDTLSYFFTWNTGTNNLRYTIESDVNFGAYSNVADYFMYTFEQSYSNDYHEGIRYSEASSSFYTPGEGWGRNIVNGAGGGYSLNLTASTPSPYTGPGAPDAVFAGRSVSNSNAQANTSMNHHLIWQVGTSNTEIYNQIWAGYNQAQCNTLFSTALLSDGNTPLRWIIVDDLGAATDYQALQYFSLEYARQTDFGGANSIEFKIANDAQGKIRLDITNAGTPNGIMLVHGDVPKIVPFVQNGGVYSTLIPNSVSGGDQTVIYQDSTLIQSIGAMSPVTTNAQFTDFSAVSLDSAYLMIYHPLLESASINYGNYRSSEYNTVLANVEELYMQFGGGIRKHINGIRRFSHFVHNNSTVKPVGLFLMGKGIREANFNITTSDGPGTRQHAARFEASLIPSFGQPSSDVSITAGLVGSSEWAPMMATGRISARTNQELQDYLDKIIVYENEQDPFSIYDTPNKDWQKHVIHFAGGSDANEQAVFQSYMNNMESKIADSLFGGYVHRVYKTSSNPLDPTILQEVTDRISEGVSLMSYFGHSSGTNSGFEINLDDPSNWNNNGKYPLMLVNSCYNGNIYQWSSSKSEEFVQVANYGAIGYIASVSLGFSNNLNSYSQNFYQKVSTTHYGETIGNIMKATVESMEFPGANLYTETTCSQMVLNGDPMMRLNPHEKPEIELTPDDVSFLPTNLDLTVDSIEMRINLTNLGRSITDTFELRIERNFPSTTIDSIYSFFLPELHYTDTFTFKMPLQPNIAIGQNTFNIRIDIPSVIDEQYEEITNNQLTRTLYVNVDGIVPVIPYEFAVVPEDSVTLIASTIDPIAGYETYRFEIDTVDFEGTVPQSGEYRYALVSGFGGVKEINPSQWLNVGTGASDPLVCEDSVVYFWRVSIAGDTIWRESSFQYITGKVGWGQDHFYQFKKNGFYNLGYDRPNRRRDFQPTLCELECNVNSATWSPSIYYNNYLVCGDQRTYGVGVGLTPKIHVAVLDSITLESWICNSAGGFGAFNSGAGAYGIDWKDFHFLQSNAAQLDSFQNMVLNEVPDGNYMLIYTPMQTSYDQWNAIDSVDMYNVFSTLAGSNNVIVPGQPNEPFAFFVKKGDTTSAQTVFAPLGGGSAQLTVDIMGSAYVGEEHSTLIGPASNWGSVHWKQDPEESPTNDSTILTIRGYDYQGAHLFTMDTLFSLDDSIINLNNLIDANAYPFIDLSASYIDSVGFTPAQVDRWHVLYSPLPEAAIDGSNPYTWSIANDTIEEGQDITFAVDVRNIFTVDMDSLLIDYWIEDAYNVKHPIPYNRQDSLRVNDVLRDTITFSTTGLGGVSSFWMEVNPYVNGSYTITDQPEQEHFNNVLQIPFFVNPDDKNPILDVTFNGTHILNGDIVDPYGEVLITLKDDNEYLIMDNVSDTALFGVYLTDPTGNQTRIPFEHGGNTIMQWVPANSQNKRFKIIWPTEFEMDGEYTLFVQGADRSGNLSGDIQYRVSFEIIHKSTITAMMNYPNPFSTSTRFVFTLTGSEVPDDILIQIMTVSGRIVREITEDELGPIQIGRNITEFEWDGTDQFGDPLANGVYLYRVKTRLNGESIEHRESGADQYFKKEFGKMYLMR
jgi:hypothetical protein